MRAALAAMLAEWGRLSPGYALAALAVYALSHLTTALRLHAVLDGLRLPVRRREAFFANICSIFVNNVTPGRVGGEVCRVVLLNRRAGVDVVRATVALAYDRLTDLVPLALMIVLSIPTLRHLVPAGSGAVKAAAIGFAIIAILAGGALLFLRSDRGERLLAEWQDRFIRFRVERRAMGRAIAYSAAMFVLDLARLILVAHAFGVSLSPERAVVLSVVGTVGGLVPTPGGIGAIEGGLCGALVLFGVPLDQAMAITLFERGLSYGLGSAGGAVTVSLLGGRSLFRALRGGGEGNPAGSPAAAVASSLAGAALLVECAWLYRIDAVRCAEWPARSLGLIQGGIYLIAIALLTRGWLKMTKMAEDSTPPLTRIFGLGLLVHVAAILAPPFLSDDGLAYSAIGRAMAKYHQSPFVPLGEALPPGDPFRALIAEYTSWIAAGSAYSAGFNQIARAVSFLAGDDLGWHLRLFQGIGLAMTLASALLSARAAAALDGENPRRAAAQAAALVLFCPVTIVEATINGHNDSLLMGVSAAFAFFVATHKPVRALLALALGPLVKLSGLLLPALFVLHHGFARLRDRLGRRALLGLAAIVFAGMIIVVWQLLPVLERYANSTATLFGRPVDELPFCTRSVECLPRVLLQAILHMPVASWLVGIGFRAAAGALLVYFALRAGRGARLLAATAAFLLFYYLYFHAFSQAWYLLSLVPLLPWIGPRLRPAAIAFCVAALIQYALDLPFNAHCDRRAIIAVPAELVKALIVIIPPSVLLLRARRADRMVTDA